MKKKSNHFFRIFLFIITSFIFHSGYAQRINHSLMVWGEAGYSSFFTEWDNYKNTGSIGAGIGGGYNATFGNHFIISTGVEYLSLNSSAHRNNFIIQRELYDTEEDLFIMEYAVHKLKCTDKTHNIFIPLFIGFKTNSNRRNKADFFMQVGGKFGVMLASNSHFNIDYTTRGDYDRFIVPFEEMPNHFFDTQNRRGSHPLNFTTIQAVVAMEMGLEIPFYDDRKAMRVSIFADYGLLNRQISEVNPKPKELFIFDERTLNNISVNSLYETNYKLSTQTNSFFAGVKVAFLLGLPLKQKCLSCPYAQKSKNTHHRKYAKR